MIRFLQTHGRFQKASSGRLPFHRLHHDGRYACSRRILGDLAGGSQRQFRSQGKWPGRHHPGSGSGGAQHDAAAPHPRTVQALTSCRRPSMRWSCGRCIWERQSVLACEATDDDLRYEMQHGGLSQALYPNGTFIGADAVSGSGRDRSSTSAFRSSSRNCATN